jgi:hypothetical protein
MYTISFCKLFQLDELRHNLRLEMKKREQMEDKIKSVEEAEIRRSANKIAVELRNQQEIDNAHTRIVINLLIDP